MAAVSLHLALALALALDGAAVHRRYWAELVAEVE
jgi:hypothetical protein